MRKIQRAQIFFLIAVALIVGSSGLLEQGAWEQEMRAELSLTQADELYSRREYQKTIEGFLPISLLWPVDRPYRITSIKKL